ncbi:MAG: hypothetical protein IPJ46_06220 [Anaerolineales bacterium]|nr:hypothetical protein [Anaerolineales bacterium]
MLSRLLNYFRDEEDNNPSFIQMTRNILIFVIVINIFLLPLVIGLFGDESRNIPALITLSITLILEIISLFLAVRGKVGMAKLIVPLALIAAIAIIASGTNGLRDISIVGLPFVFVIAALLLGPPGHLAGCTDRSHYRPWYRNNGSTDWKSSYKSWG